MKFQKICFFLIFSLSMSISCKRNNDKIDYDSGPLDEIKGDSVTLVPVETEIEFGQPESIDFINDSLMIVFDENVNDYVAHIIDTKGNYINSFGRKGRGEGEFISPADISLNQAKDSVFIFDFMLNEIFGFEISKLLNHDDQTPSRLKFNIDAIPNQEYRFNHIECGSPGECFAFSLEKNRIITLKDGAPSFINKEYPPTDPDPETNRSIWNFPRGLNAVSPDRTKIVVGTYIGGLFEIFDVKDGKVSSRIIKGFYKPYYQYAKGAVPKCVITDYDKNITGFRTISSGEKDFITVIGGPDSKRINEILFFDYDGNLKDKKIAKSEWIDILGRNNKGEIYCFGWDKDFENQYLFRVED